MEESSSGHSDALEQVPLRSSSSTSSLPDMVALEMSPRSKKRRFSLGRLGRKSPRTDKKQSPRDSAPDALSPREESPRSKHRRTLSLGSSRRGGSHKAKKDVKDSERLEKQLGKVNDAATRKCFKLQANETLRRLKDLYDMNVAQADELAKLRKQVAEQDAQSNTYRQSARPKRPAGSNSEYYPMYPDQPPPIPPGGRLDVEDVGGASGDGCGCSVM